MRNVRALLVGVATLLACPVAFANVKLPQLMTDHMVLQRDAPITLWGWAEPGETVSIAFRGKQLTVRAGRSRAWRIVAGPFSAGGPYDMIIQGNNRLEMHDILIGDVWLASGQSNMELSLADKTDGKPSIDNADIELATASFPQIRLFKVGRYPALTPAGDVTTAGWRAVTPDTVGEFSAVAYFFGRELQHRYHIPIGLIESSWGGTTAETWTSAHALKAFPELNATLEAVAHLDDKTRAALEGYRKRLKDWYQAQGTKDRASRDGVGAWAKAQLDTREWHSIALPRPDDAFGKDFNGFDGVVWFRRILDLPPEDANKAVVLRLGNRLFNDTTFFNGQKIGEGSRNENPYYIVPAEYVHAGKNVVAMRLVGRHEQQGSDGVGIFGAPNDMTATVVDTVIPLSGDWLYRPGPDLQDYPGSFPQPSPPPCRPTMSRVNSSTG